MFERRMAMCKKSIRIFTFILLVGFSISSVAFALCYESTGGKLQSGSIEKYLPSILRSYESDVSNGAVYTIQKKDGFYFKICDETDQVAHFMEKWVYPEINEGEWKSVLIAKEKSKIYIIKEIGIYMVKKGSEGWKVWEYSATNTKVGKKESTTSPITVTANDLSKFLADKIGEFVASKDAVVEDAKKPDGMYHRVQRTYNSENSNLMAVIAIIDGTGVDNSIVSIFSNGKKIQVAKLEAVINPLKNNMIQSSVKLGPKRLITAVILNTEDEKNLLRLFQNMDLTGLANLGIKNSDK